MIMCDGVLQDDGMGVLIEILHVDVWYHQTCLKNLSMKEDDIVRDKITCPLCTDYNNDLTLARKLEGN